MAGTPLTMRGTLFFPYTPFGEDGEVDVAAFREHVARGMEHAPGGVFAACGTGEFHALDAAEHRAVVEAAVDVVDGRVPVLAGAGGSVRAAVAHAAAAREAGADGVLLMPPYLAAGPPTGIVAYARAVAETGMPVIVYQRSTARLDERSAVELTRIPGIVGIKDGIGDLEQMRRLVRAVGDELGDDGDRFQLFNGLPTAEVTQVAYRAIGVDLYSSAAFAFAPDLAVAFQRALEAGDAATVARLERTFLHPLVRLRDRTPGYAVAIVKAGAELAGHRTGGVRAPLVALSLAEHDELRAIIAAGRAAALEVATA